MSNKIEIEINPFRFNETSRLISSGAIKDYDMESDEQAYIITLDDKEPFQSSLTNLKENITKELI